MSARDSAPRSSLPTDLEKRIEEALAVQPHYIQVSNRGEPIRDTDIFVPKAIKALAAALSELRSLRERAERAEARVANTQPYIKRAASYEKVIEAVRRLRLFAATADDAARQYVMVYTGESIDPAPALAEFDAALAALGDSK